MKKFSFTSALMHFTRTDGPLSFIWKFIAIYSVALMLIWAVWFIIMAVSIPTFADSIARTGGFTSTSATDVLAVFSGFILFLVAAGIFETAALRHYIRREPFSLKFGKDELRTFAVFLFWFLMLLAILTGMSMLTVIILPIAGLTPVGVVISIVWNIVVFLAPGIFGILFSAASSVTFRDEKVRFFKARSAMKGNFWKAAGAYVVVYVALIIAYILAQLIAMALTGISAGSPAQLLNPVSIIFWVLCAAGLASMYAMFHLVTLGIPARAAIAEDGEAQTERTAEVFA
ncbi:MAG: hypothetical protein CMK06_12640 [Ponticaulis sp.]|nr:hypothetical protein [Ponticaulis sp.]